MKKSFIILLVLFLLMNTFSVTRASGTKSAEQGANTSAVTLKDGNLYVRTNGNVKKIGIKVKYYCDGQKDYILACLDNNYTYKYVLINKKTLATRELKYNFVKKFVDDSISPILGCKNNKYYFLSKNLVIMSTGKKEKVIYSTKSSNIDIEQCNLIKILTSDNKIGFVWSLSPRPLVIDTRKDSIEELKMIDSEYELIGITDDRVCYIKEDHIPSANDTVYMYMSDYDNTNCHTVMNASGCLYNNYSAQIGDKAFYSNYAEGIYLIDLSKETSKHIFERQVVGICAFKNQLFISTISDDTYKNLKDTSDLGNDSIGCMNLNTYQFINKIQIKNTKVGKDFKYNGRGIFLNNIDYYGNFIFKMGVDYDINSDLTCKYDIQKKKVTIIDMFGCFSTVSSSKKFENLKKEYIGKDITNAFLIK